MNRSKLSFSFIAALLSCSLTIGCGDKAGENSPAQPAAAEHGHTHEDGSNHSHDEGHSHGAGPHDGTLADWGGGKYHVEFTVDHDRQEATVYILGSDEKTPVPVEAEKLLLTIKDPELQTDLLPVPFEGETVGNSSRFIGTHDALATVMEYEGIISAVIDGTPYAGNFKEESHTHD
ncbi:MAG: hypothetical protein VW875_03220 [Planctomycetaceae bacterium]